MALSKVSEGETNEKIYEKCKGTGKNSCGCYRQKNRGNIGNCRLHP